MNMINTDKKITIVWTCLKHEYLQGIWTYKQRKIQSVTQIDMHTVILPVEKLL
jgi:hypothetical protein